MKQLALTIFIAFFAFTFMQDWAQRPDQSLALESSPTQSLDSLETTLQNAQADVELADILSKADQAQFSKLSAEVWSRKLSEQSGDLNIDAQKMLEAARNSLRLKADDTTRLEFFKPIETPFFKPIFDPETGEITELEVNEFKDLDRQSALKAIEALKKACGGSSACDPNPPRPKIPPKPRQPEPVIDPAICETLCDAGKCPDSCEGGQDD